MVNRRFILLRLNQDEALWVVVQLWGGPTRPSFARIARIVPGQAIRVWAGAHGGPVWGSIRDKYFSFRSHNLLGWGQGNLVPADSNEIRTGAAA